MILVNKIENNVVDIENDNCENEKENFEGILKFNINLVGFMNENEDFIMEEDVWFCRNVIYLYVFVVNFLYFLVWIWIFEMFFGYFNSMDVYVEKCFCKYN